MWFLNTEVSPCQFFSSHEHEGQRNSFTDLAPRDLSIFSFNHKTLLLTNLSRLPFLDAKRDRMKLYWYDVTEKAMPGVYQPRRRERQVQESEAGGQEAANMLSVSYQQKNPAWIVNPVNLASSHKISNPPPHPSLPYSSPAPTRWGVQGMSLRWECL